MEVYFNNKKNQIFESSDRNVRVFPFFDRLVSYRSFKTLTMCLLWKRNLLEVRGERLEDIG